MKLAGNNQGTMLDSHGVQQTSTFNIARTSHMFTVLSSGLYSDKISAVLREIGCNATDAHIMHGTPERPIQVKLPSRLDRSFYIKDWGPGLNHEEVTQLYTTYGWSSKQNNDDVTGAFGLGSKSPFAYTLQNRDNAAGFSVEAVKDGVKRIYTCFINDEGAPCISQMFEGPCDEDWTHGVKVSLPVQEQDVGEFHLRAKSIFQWFKVKPELLGLEGDMPEPQFAVKGENFALDPQSNTTRGTGVVMGGVFYPIDTTNLRDISATERALLNSRVVMWVPMGTVMMTPSREGLEYTDRTRKGISERLAKAAEEIATRVYQSISAPASSTWAWYKRIHEYHDQLTYGVRGSMGAFLQQAGMDADRIKHIEGVLQQKSTTLPAWVGDFTSAESRLDVWLYRKGTRDGSVARKSIQRGKVAKGQFDSESVVMAFTSDVRVLFENSSNADWRVRNAIRTGQLDYAVVVVGKDHAATEAYARKISEDAQLQGIPCEGTGTLQAYVVSDEEKARRKRMRELPAEEIYGNVECQHVRIDSTGSPLETTLQLKDVPEGQRYFIVRSDCGRRGRSKRYSNKTTEGSLSFVQDYYSRGLFSTLCQLLHNLPEPITGFVMLDKESSVKALRLNEMGYSALLPRVEELLNEEDVVEHLTATKPKVEGVSLDQQWSMDSFGPAGRLAYVMSQDETVCRQLRAALARTELLEDIETLLKEKGPGPAYQAYEAVIGKITGMSLTLQDTKPVQAPRDFKNRAEEKYPLLRFLNLDVDANISENALEGLIYLLKEAMRARPAQPRLALAA